MHSCSYCGAKLVYRVHSFKGFQQEYCFVIFDRYDPSRAIFTILTGAVNSELKYRRILDI